MSKKEETKDESKMTSLEFLQHSLEFNEKMHQDALKRAKEISDDMKSLQEDIKIIKTDRLRQAAASVHNQLVMERKQLLDRIKDARVNVDHIRSIIKQLRNKGKK